MNEQIDKLMEVMAELSPEELAGAKEYLVSRAARVIPKTELSGKMASDIANELDKSRQSLKRFSGSISQIQKTWINGEAYIKVQTIVDYINSHDDGQHAQPDYVDKVSRFDKHFAGNLQPVQPPKASFTFVCFTDEGWYDWDGRNQQFVLNSDKRVSSEQQGA